MSAREKPWFPPSSDRDHLESVLYALSVAMGHTDSDRIVQDYLNGRSVLTSIGKHGVWHFDNMTRTLGMKPPPVES